MQKQLQDAVSISKKSIKIVFLRESIEESIPGNGILFNELVDTTGINFNDKNNHYNVISKIFILGVVFDDLVVLDSDRSNEVAFLPYSSGTTGMPKGVELTHLNININCEQVNADLGGGKNTTFITNKSIKHNKKLYF